MEQQRTEIYHRSYNLDGKDNLTSLPARPAVYGIFAIVDGEPVHCRAVGHARNLQAAIRQHFDGEADAGVRTFMRGPWIKMLVYEPFPAEAADADLAAASADWARQYSPSCDEEGEYASDAERVGA